MPASSDSLAQYLGDIGRHPVLTAREERRLAALVVAGDDAARRRFVECNLRLVVFIARRYQGLGLDLLDLIQEGNVGLMRAVTKYDPARGARFGRCAQWWIKQAICRALSVDGRVVRAPRRVAEAATSLARVEAELANRLGRRPSAAEVGTEAGVSANVVADVRRAQLAPVSLAEPRGEDAVLGDLVGDDGANDPALSPRNEDDAAQLRRACRALTPRLRRVLELRFGLDGGAGCTLRQVADELGVSRERARHLEARALGQLAGSTQVRALRAA